MNPKDSSWSVKGRTCVVTGGNSGIGLHTALGLARLGARVALVSRSRERGEAALETIGAALAADPDHADGRVDLVVGDLGSLGSTRALADELLGRYPTIHVLVNNAGLWMSERQVTSDGLETTFAVNHLAPFLLTNLLLERLLASAPARIVNVSSEGHRRGRLDWDDLQAERGFGPVKAYCDSKLANVLFTRELARRLEGSGVTTNALHPGVVNTNIAQNAPRPLRWLAERLGPLLLATPEQGARTSLHLATAPALDGVSGRYFKSCREARPARAAQDDAAARRLWAISEELAGLSADAPALRR
jgi:NAD(P)-dependent dehydrogenase (short-subunit alcohol dehydrogenase family)